MIEEVAKPYCRKKKKKKASTLQKKKTKSKLNQKLG